jgi:hypothetical protein
MTIGNESVLYDNIKNTYKVGEEVVLLNYINIKSEYYEECIKLYDAAIYKSDMGFASNLDYYFDGKNTIKFIIPDVPPAKEYFIASRLEKNVRSSKFLYTKRFQIISGGKINPLKSKIDSCGIKRTSIYGNPNKDKSQTLPNKNNNNNNNKNNKNNNKNNKNNKNNNNNEDINKINKTDPKVPKEPVSNNNTIIINAQDMAPSNTTVQEPISKIDDTTTTNNSNNSNSNNNNNNNNTKTSQVDPDKNSSNNKKRSLKYILFSSIGLLFCSLLVFGFLFVNKKKKNDTEELLTSTYQDSLPSPKLKGEIGQYNLPLEYGYTNNVYETNYNTPRKNSNVNVTTNKVNTSHKHSIDRNKTVSISLPITALTKNNEQLFRSYSSAGSQNVNNKEPTSHKYTNGRNKTISISLPITATVKNNEHLFRSYSSGASHNIRSSSPPINLVDPIETPSTDIKFVATTSYKPKNSNEVAISSLDIIYIVGYLDENFAQILNITTNSYGVIPISELNKIQP